MNRRFFSILLICIGIICLTGCGKEKKEVVIPPDYDIGLLETYDCNFENVSYADSDYIVSDSKLYLLTSKKNVETENHCKPLFNNDSNYKFIGKIRTYTDGEYFLYYDNNGTLFGVDRNGQISNYKLANYVDVNSLIHNKNIDYFYYTNTTLYQRAYYYYISGNTIYYQTYKAGNEIVIPSDEKILYHGIHSNNYSTTDEKMMVITNKNKYIIDIAKNDRCYEYEGVQCTYTNIKTNVYDILLNDYKDNIKYFGGKFLITKDNKYRFVRKYDKLD